MSGAFIPVKFLKYNNSFTKSQVKSVSLCFRLHPTSLSSSVRTTCVQRAPPVCSSHRPCSTEAPLAAPPVEGVDRNYPPKIQRIVDDISQLTLIEVADLNELLKVSTSWIAFRQFFRLGRLAVGQMLHFVQNWKVDIELHGACQTLCNNSILSLSWSRGQQANKLSRSAMNTGNANLALSPTLCQLGLLTGHGYPPGQ